MTRRFSRAAVLDALYARIETIAREEGFDRSRGPGQLRNTEDAQDLLRAIAYGRMQAWQLLATEIENGRLIGAQEGKAS